MRPKSEDAGAEERPVSFLAVGNCTLDDVVTPEGRISPRQLGGNAVYAAAGMRLWGASVSLVSVVGADYPQEWLDKLARAKIDVSAVTRIDEPHLLRSRAFYFADGSRTDRVDEARDHLPARAEDLIDLESEYADLGSPLHRRIWPSFCPDLSRWPDLARRASFAHLAPGPLACNRANAAFLKRRSGGRVALTFDWPWWDWDREGQVDQALLGSLDYLLPSIEELALHAEAAARDRGEPGPEGADAFTAGRRLLAYGPQAVGVKMGARGMRLLIRGKERWLQVPPCPVKAVDPTGAGDAFCGGFLVGLAETGDPVRAAAYGAVSASFIIQEFGVLHSLQVDSGAARTRLRDYRSRCRGWM